MKSMLVPIANLPATVAEGQSGVAWTVAPNYNVDEERVVMDVGRVSGLVRQAGMGALTVGQHMGSQSVEVDAGAVLGGFNSRGGAYGALVAGRFAVDQSKAEITPPRRGVPLAYDYPTASMSLNRTYLAEETASRSRAAKSREHAWADTLDDTFRAALVTLHQDKLYYNFMHRTQDGRTSDLMGNMSVIWNVIEGSPSWLFATVVGYGAIYAAMVSSQRKELTAAAGHNPAEHKRRPSYYASGFDMDRLFAATLRTKYGGRLIGVKK